MPKTIFFPPVEPVWEFGRDSVRFYAVIEHRAVVCRIPVEVLAAHFEASRLDESEAIRVFETHRQIIEETVVQKLEAEEAKNPGFREIILSDADFRQDGAAPLPRMRVKTSLKPEVINDPELFAAAKAADAILEESIARGKTRVTVTWSGVPTLGGYSLLKLTLNDERSDSTVSGLFTVQDVRNEDYARVALFRLWDDLLRERGRRLMQTPQTVSATEG